MSDNISKLLVSKKLLLKKFKTLNLSSITKMRSYSAYFGINEDKKFTVVYVRDAKSRFILKDANSLLKLHEDICRQENKIVKNKILFYNCEICSKSIKVLKDNGWIIYDFV